MRRISTLSAAAFLAGLLAAGGCSTNPVTGKSELVLMSEQEEIATGKQYYSITTQLSEGETPHRNVQELVMRVGMRMARASERPDLPWQFNVVDSNEPNAYALPGGKLSITRGLISKMESEDQLASVLGHEIGHVTARHAVVSASRQQLLGAVLGVGGAVLQTTGTPGAGAIQLASQIGATLLVQKYSRDQERQADELGMKYMTAAGYNPRAFVETMRILQAASKQEPSKFETLFASHPVTSERIATAEQRLASGYTEAQTRPANTAEFRRAIAPLKDEAPAFALADEAKELAKNRRIREAEERLARAVSMVPGSPILNALWSDTLYDAGDYRRSEEISGRANTLNPQLYYGRLVNGAADWRLRDLRGALEQLNAAEKLVPDTVLVAYFAGRTLEDLGDREAAAKQYAKVAQSTQGQGEYGQYAVTRLREWGYLTQ
ncbi:MAG TPA: M48 family metalloprotease [Thermoanaerobaculia bacterium]|nr:M48 family metalloprotease [Thermoanaerobaculia bacterium]